MQILSLVCLERLGRASPTQHPHGRRCFSCGGLCVRDTSRLQAGKRKQLERLRIAERNIPRGPRRFQGMMFRNLAEVRFLGPQGTKTMFCLMLPLRCARVVGAGPNISRGVGRRPCVAVRFKFRHHVGRGEEPPIDSSRPGGRGGGMRATRPDSSSGTCCGTSAMLTQELRSARFCQPLAASSSRSWRADWSHG